MKTAICGANFLIAETGGITIVESEGNGRMCLTLPETLIAIVGGRRLDEHANPGEATVHVLHGRVSLSSGDSTWSGSPGDLLIVPDALHSLDAIEDSAVLLTVAKTR